MKWVKRDKDELVGTREVRTYFLWLPLTIGDTTRWLERACVDYEYVRKSYWHGGMRQWCYYYRWEPQAFID